MLTTEVVYTYSAVRDPLLVAVLLCSPEFLGQLGAVDVGVQLSYRAQHDHLKQLRTCYVVIIMLSSILRALY